MPLHARASELRFNPNRPYTNPSMCVLTYWSDGWVLRTWSGWQIESSDWVQSGPPRGPDVRITNSKLSWLNWGNAEAARAKHKTGFAMRCEQASGWPLPALWHSMERVAVTPAPGRPAPAIVLGSNVNIQGGILLHKLPGPLGIGVSRVRVLPSNPIVAGLAINIAFWTAVSFFIGTLSRVSRRHFRRRRGHCPGCNYDLLHKHSAGCPECGWNRTSS